MRRAVARLLVVSVTAAVVSVVVTQPANAASTGSYLVEFGTGTDPDAAAAHLTDIGAVVTDVYRDVFSGVALTASPRVIEQVRADPDVVRVETNDRITVDTTPPPTIEQTDPPWGLDRLDQRALPLSNSYSYSSAGAGVTAYIVDSGIFDQHVDFGGRVRSGFSTLGGFADCNGHGTHVAGIVGGQYAGVAKNVSLVSVRVLDCAGSTDESQLLAALNWVIADHPTGAPAVVNLSLGGAASGLVDFAVQSVVSDGITVVVSAGNSHVDACTQSPARVAAAITVGATGADDARAAFSNFGHCLDLFAPGVNIPSDGIGSPTEIVLKSGTSMSAPHVTGAAAVLLSERPTWTPAQVARDLGASATLGVVGDPGPESPNALLFASPKDPPVNDDFAGATTFDVTNPAAAAGTSIDAGLEAGEPSHAAGGGGASVWWAFTAPDYGTVTLSTEGSSFDTVLSAYSGSAVSGLTEMASNDGPANGSNVRIHVAAGRTYHVAVDGVAGASGAIVLAHTWTPSSFVPVVPARVLESRSGLGAATVDGLFVELGARAGGSVTELPVLGRGGVDPAASAVVLTVTVTNPVAAGFVTVFPCDSGRPLASNVNFVAGATVANSVITGVGAGGLVCLFTSVATHLVVDVDAFSPASSSFKALVPARLLESRSGAGAATVDGSFAGLGLRAAGSVTELPVSGRGGVGTAASAVVLTVTVTEPAAPGFVTVFPCGSGRPLASNVNFAAGATVANSVVSGVGAGGAVCVFTSVATHLVVDVDGYFPPSSSFVSLVPARLLESRSGAGAATVDGAFVGLGVRAAGSVTELPVAGRGGVDPTATAVVVTVTVTEPVAAGFVTVFPCGSSRPLASNVNFVDGATVANSFVAGLGPNGAVCLFTSVATHLVVDVDGHLA